MVEFSHFHELYGCKDLGEVQLEHGYKLSKWRRIKSVLHLFRRLINIFYLSKRLGKPLHLIRRLVKPFHLFRRLIKPFYLFRRSIKPFYVFRRPIKPFHLFRRLIIDGYYVAYKPITLSCIFFMFIKMKFIHCHSFVMFPMKFMSMCNH